MFWRPLIALAILSVVLSQLQFTHSADVTNSGCPKNFTLVGDKCLFANNNWNSWYQADRFCQSLGAGLVSLENKTQLQLLNQWLNSTTSFPLDYWTSGNSFDQKETYYWQSTGELARYLPWATGQPKPANGNCIALHAGQVYVFDYTLTIMDCIKWASPICEKKPQQFSSRLCLKSTAYETAEVLVN